MATKLIAVKNIKIVATGFNPPLFSEYWLKKEKLIPEDCEFSPPPISTPQFTQISSKKFTLLVLPDQLQYSIIEDSKMGIDFIKSIPEKIPSLGYMAMGFNFDYFVPDNEIKPGLFFIPHNKLFQDFKVGDARFGTFLSKNFENSRLSLSIKPTRAIDPKGTESDVYHFSFNYHFDIAKGESTALISTIVGNWNKYFKYSEKLMDL